ncbi:CynX/NimT family MFS transporter [Sodalis sp. C49]|uniref:CynX/NimT family MFS transporter n=1 Tax=Sodalis sp. C49 TaxID=3228929 RepID=UPI003965B5FF
MAQLQTPLVPPSLVSNSGFFLFIVLLTAANLRAPITAIGPVLDNIRATFGLSASAAGWLNFIPLIMFAALAPAASWLGNRAGLEKSLWGGVCLITLGSLLRISGSEAGLWSGTLILSIGIAAANVLLPPLIKRDFKNHTAKYIGLYASTMSITASLASGIAVPLARAGNAGWFLSVGIWTTLPLIAAIAWLPQLKKTKRPAANIKMRGETRLRNPWRSVLGWQVSLFMALHSMVFYTLIDWFTPFAQDKGFSQMTAGWLLFVYQATAIIANLMCMLALKKFRDQRLIGFIASFAIFTGLSGLLLAPSLALLWLIIAGLGAGASMVTCLSLFNLRAGDHAQAAHLSGMAQCVGYGLAAVGPLFFGILHEHGGDWSGPLLMLLAMSLLQLIIAPLAGRNKQIG